MTARQSAENDGPICFNWETYWPHAVRSIAETRTTPDRGKVTCDACLWALGTQVSPPPRTSVIPPGPCPDTGMPVESCLCMTHDPDGAHFRTTRNLPSANGGAA